MRVRVLSVRVVFAGLLVAASALLGVAHAAPSSGTPVVPVYTWTGHDATAPSPNINWSDGGNWLGGNAPLAGSPVNLVFPPLTGCSASSAQCAASSNDLVGLVINNLSVAGTASAPAVNVGGGQAITISTLQATGGTPNIGLDMALTGSQAWSVTGALLTIHTVQGSGALTVNLANGAGFAAGGSLASWSYVGQDPAAAPASNGTVFGDFGVGSSPQSVHFTNVAVSETGFTTSGTTVLAHSAVSVAPANLGLTYQWTVTGDLTLDPASSAAFSTVPYSNGIFGGGLNTPLLSATGAVNLGSAQLAFGGQCVGYGSSMVFLKTSGSLSGLFSKPTPGGPVAIHDGDVVASPNCFYRIHYDTTAGTVTATAVPPPTVGLSSSHSPAIPGQPITYTALVIGNTPYSGTVAFTDNGMTIPGCATQAVRADTTNPAYADAACTVTYTATGSHSIAAAYSGDLNNDPSTPTSITQSIVPAPTATITSQSGLFARGEVLQGTANDTGGPGLQGIILYYHDYIAGGPSGAVLATCSNCGIGQTNATWTFTLPANGIPGIYAFVAQPVDTAFNFGPASNAIYQIVE